MGRDRCNFVCIFSLERVEMPEGLSVLKCRKQDGHLKRVGALVQSFSPAHDADELGLIAEKPALTVLNRRIKPCLCLHGTEHIRHIYT